jgi:hypothetical protein
MRIASIFSTTAWTLGRKVSAVVLFVTLVFFGTIAWELFAPEYFECHQDPQPFTSQKSPQQAVFTARVVATGTLWPMTGNALHEGSPRSSWALAVVQKKYWGLAWWDQKIVMITLFARGGRRLEREETYFIEGNRSPGWFTRFLPIFEIYCTRTTPLKYAEIDLRALRDGPPKNGVRIMGYTYRRTSGGSEAVPGTSVGITGPTGETIGTSDQQGLYDVTGLPPGSYIVHRTGRQAGSYWGLPICGFASLQPGSIRECGVSFP